MVCDNDDCSKCEGNNLLLITVLLVLVLVMVVVVFVFCTGKYIVQ